MGETTPQSTTAHQLEVQDLAKQITDANIRVALNEFLPKLPVVSAYNMWAEINHNNDDIHVCYTYEDIAEWIFEWSKIRIPQAQLKDVIDLLCK